MTIFVILAARFVMVFLHASKSDYPDILKQAFAQAGEIPKCIRSDEAGEYNSAEAYKIYQDHLILKQTTNANQQFQNGPSEKMVDTIGGRARTVLTDSNLPYKKFWGYAVIYAVDTYNHTPHASLGMKTPWEMHKKSLPDVSMFRPFGCRATVFIGEDKNKLEHRKLTPRGVACIHLGQGYSRGYKGWLCFNPENGKLYCTRHVVFDETFMPARAHEQRVLGHYDTTPRERFPTLIHGSYEKAENSYQELNQTPLVSTLEMIDNMDVMDKSSYKEPPCGRKHHPEADQVITPGEYDDDELSDFEQEEPQMSTASSSSNAAQPSGGNSARASGGTATQPSGGNSAQASGGTSTQPSGGDSAQASGGKSTKPSGGPTKAKPHPTVTSGGANSGVSKPMLSAGGKDGPLRGPAMYNNTDLHTFAQTDFRGSIVGNSTDKDAWTKLGPLKLATCNDGDLAEWMIGWGIGALFFKRFWKHGTGVQAKGKSSIKDRKATVLDTFLTEKLPPQVKILVEVQDNRTQSKTTTFATEVLISQDPTVDGTKEIHRNNLRAAIDDTYPGAKDNPEYTLQDLLDDSKRFDYNQGPATEEDANDSEDSEAPKPKKRKNKRKGKRKREKDSESSDEEQPKKVQTNNYTKYALKTTVNAVIQHVRACVGLAERTPIVEEGTKKVKGFRMRSDTDGVAYAALFATIQICAMSQSYDYQPAFLPLEPKNQREARKRPDAAMWRAAEMKELDMLFSRGTFQEVDRPEHYDPLPLQFVYKLKVVNGEYDKGTPKARLVALGNLQYDEEYGDTYAPTARLWTVRTLAAIAAQEGLTMKKFDLTGAFLIADLDKPILVQIPGYDLPKNKAMLLKKALYGTKSAGALYSKEIKNWLMDYGFKPCTVDETLFRLTREVNGEIKTLLISLYVDDGACCTNDEGLYQTFLKDLQAKYELSDSGDLKWHLGINVIQDLKAGTISFDQKAYIESVLKRFNMEDCSDKRTPLPPRTYLTSEDCPAVPNKEDVKVYQQLVGSLMYVACGTRPDIAFAVNSCAQFMSNPGPSHFKAAKHVLRYLKTTKDAKLTYSKQSPDMGNVLYGYVDADHAGSPEDRKSVGGYVLMLNGAAVSWSSRKIKVVSLSSFESEWYSASICGCEVIVLRRLLEEISREQIKPTVLFEDNAACIHTAMSPDKGLGPRSKHIDTRVFRLKQLVTEKVLELIKVSSAMNVADCLTKALSRDEVDRARNYMFGKFSLK